MPIESIVVSALVVAVFLVFAAVLAYGQHQTCHFEPVSDHLNPAQESDNRRPEAA